jgi:tetratricopeptide (TPR) repeat protein
MEINRKEVQNVFEDVEKYLNERNFSKAFSLLENLLKDLDPSTEEYFETVLKLSELYRNNKSYTAAEELLEKSTHYAKKFEENLYLADIYRSLSFIKLQKREFPDARKYAKKALSIVKYMKGFKADKNKANIYALLGNICFTNKKYKEALEYYNKGLTKAEKIQFDKRVITIKNDIANLYIETDKTNKAKILLKELKRKSKKIYKLAYPQVLIRLAKLEYETKSYEKAKKYLYEALDFVKQNDWKRDIAEVREELAFVYKEEGKLVKSKIQLMIAFKIYKEIGLKKKAKRIFKQITDLS